MAKRSSGHARWWLGLAAAPLLLTACPPTDDYWIHEAPAVGGSVSGSGGSLSTGGTAGTTSGAAGSSLPMAGSSGASADGGSTALGGSAGEGTAGSMTGKGGMKGEAGDTGGKGCDEDCNAGRICDPTCQGGWVPTSVPPGGFSPRERAAYASLGNQLFIWGGLNESGTVLSSGALYDPRTDSWRMVATDANTPSPRSDATAVWTGAVVLVFGGIDPAGPTAFDDGARYDPAEDVWLPMSSGPTARVAPVGAFGQDLALFFGGTDAAGDLIEGLDLYDIGDDSWETASSWQAPERVQDASIGDGDLTFWVAGGRLASGSPTDEITYYSFTNHDWNAISDSPFSARWGGFGAFIGSEFHTWGGRDVDEIFADGTRYDVGRWADLPTEGAPAARYGSHRESGWSWADGGTGMVILGGLDAPSSYLTDGARYDRDADAWTPIAPWPGGASHAYGAAGIAAGEVVVWGGRSGAALTNEGARYLLE